MAGRIGFLALLLLGLVALSTAQREVDSITEGINAFLETIEDGTGARARELQSKCTHCGVTASRPPSPPPAYPPPSPPPVVLCPPPPVRVSSPCALCKRPASPPPAKVTVPVICPPPRVHVPSPCKRCHRPASPPPAKVSVPSPAACPPPHAVKVPVPPPIVKTPSPPKKGPWCGKTQKWVKKSWGRWRRTRWVRVSVDIYCKAGEKCCKIPASWGKKSWGPKHKSKGTKTQLKCYKKCPNCWY